MSIPWCLTNDGNTEAYRGSTPGPTGLQDVADPSRSPTDSLVCLPERTPGPTGINDDACEAQIPLELRVADPDCSGLSPEAYMRMYRQLTVPYVNRVTGQHEEALADVHIYINEGIAARQSNQTERDSVQSIVRRTATRRTSRLINAHRSSHNLAIAHAYYGKAAPWEFKIYLSYALTFGRTVTSGIIPYCENTARLGVDCSGFVNSYLIARGLASRSINIDQYGRHTARAAKTDIQALDCLVWQGSDAGASEHIAIVDHTMGANGLRVVESSGSKGGLAASNYIIMSVEGGGIYTVDRGLNEHGRNYGSSSRVKIVAPI